MEDVHLWCQKRKLTIHSDKSEAMILMKRPIRPLKLGIDAINKMNEAVCLGVKIDNRLTWE